MTPCQHKQKNGGSRGNLIFVYHFDLFISNHIILNLNIIRRFGTNMLNFVIIFNFCSSIVCMLFPSTCNLTKSYSPSWKKKKMNSAVWPWCLGERYNYPCTARVTASYKHLRVVCVCLILFVLTGIYHSEIAKEGAMPHPDFTQQQLIIDVSKHIYFYVVESLYQPRFKYKIDDIVL